MSASMKIALVDVVAFAPAFAGALYVGISLPLSLACGFLAASIVNMVWASINLGN